jgi:uncharacterized protein
MVLTQFFFILSILIYSGAAQAEISLGKAPDLLTLQGETGGKIKGGGWSSSEIKGKVYVLFYVDPDENTLNDHVSAALKQEKFPLDRFGSIAVVNMAATWKPNFAIENVLQKKQVEFPHTIYVKDFKKALVKQWQLADDNNDVLAFDKDGAVIFAKFGKLSDTDVAELIQAIRKNL